MTTVRLMTGIAGTDFSYAAGDVREFRDADAKRLIDAGLAEPVKKPAPAKPQTKQGKPAAETAAAAPADLETTEAK